MEQEKPRYTPPTPDALRALLRRAAHQAHELADAIPTDLTPEQRLDADRMIGDLRDQLTRVERAVGLMRRTAAPKAEPCDA